MSRETALAWCLPPGILLISIVLSILYFFPLGMDSGIPFSYEEGIAIFAEHDRKLDMLLA
jgi:hypothetical protein